MIDVNNFYTRWFSHEDICEWSQGNRMPVVGDSWRKLEVNSGWVPAANQAIEEYIKEDLLYITVDNDGTTQYRMTQKGVYLWKMMHI